ncbi:MAG: rhomboid family intramembrane serine protease [Simkaniaceae bacterium]|nr:rhomboid family intramembrane serine protease [Simkaniaceae bacterium]
MFDSAFQFQAAPKSLKFVITTILSLSLIAALTLMVPLPFIGVNLQTLLSLSSWGVSKGFLWQLVTYLFVQPIGTEVTFSFLLTLFLNSFFLFVVGKTLIYYKDSRDFIKLFFGGGLVAALAATLIMSITPYPLVLAGPSTALYALLAAWIFIFPEREVLLFLILPIRVKWLLIVILGSSLFIDLANGNFLSFFTYASAISFGYFYALLTFEEHSPYDFLQPFEEWTLSKKRTLFKREKVEVYIDPDRSKVYDFKTGKVILDDDTFVDVCLEKISRFGRSSLTLRERIRMHIISRRKRR